MDTTPVVLIEPEADLLATTVGQPTQQYLLQGHELGGTAGLCVEGVA